MLNQVIAVRFDRRAGTGKTKPCFIACMDGADEEVEVVAKLSAGCERGVAALAIEALAAMLAADLGLPVPEPYLVQLVPEFIDLIPDAEIKDLASRSCEIAFGAKRLPPAYAAWMHSRNVPVGMLQAAQEVFAFDALIDNMDRRPTNPNCLSEGNSIAIYDHEMAFPGQLLLPILRPPPPWQVGGLGFYGEPDHHIFLSALKGRPVNLNRLEGAWQGIGDARLAEYEAAMPPHWNAADEEVRRITRLIAGIRDNIGAAMAEVARVLG